MNVKKPIIPTPVKNIDKILNAIYAEQGLDYDGVKEKSSIQSDEETETALIKLCEDKYIIPRNNDATIAHHNVKAHIYMASYGGVIHKLKGGYEQEIINSFEEKNLNQQVIADQKSLAGRMNLLTLVLVIVAVPTALVALADLYWDYHWFHLPAWWGMVALNIVVSVSASYFMWVWLQKKRSKKQQ